MTDDQYFERFCVPLTVMKTIMAAGLPKDGETYTEIMRRLDALSLSERLAAVMIAGDAVEDIFSRGTQPDDMKGGIQSLLD